MRCPTSVTTADRGYFDSEEILACEEAGMRRLDPQQAGLFEGEMGLLLKNSPQSINAEPCHVVIEGMA